MKSRFVSLLKIRWLSVLSAVMLVMLQQGRSPVELWAADYDVVGALAIAVEPDAKEELGLTEKQLTQLQDLIAEKEAEILASAMELRNLSPEERNARLAEFRYATENAGLMVLSAQQRAKLEQMRLKRYGLRVLADPVVARRLQISPEQTAIIQQSLAQGTATGAIADNGGASGEAIVNVLNESQRQAFRSMLLGELPPDANAITSAPAEGPIPDDDEPVHSVPAAVEPQAPPVVPPPDDEMLSEMAGPAVPARVESNSTDENGPAVAEHAPPSPEMEKPDAADSAKEEAKSLAEESSPGEGNQQPPEPAQPGEVQATQGREDIPADMAAEPPVSPPQESPEEVPAGANGPEGANAPAPAAMENEGEPPAEPPREQPKTGPGEESQQGVPPPQHGTTQPNEVLDKQPQPVPMIENRQLPGSQEVRAAVSEATPPTVIGDGEGSKTMPPGPQGPVAGGGQVPQPQPISSTATDQQPTGVEQVPQLPSSDVKLRFNFRYQPWKEVLDWLAQQAGLSLVMEAPPPGTFNYVDDHEFTPTQAIDLLNSVLLTKGYVLVRRERMLMLFNVDDGIPPNMVETVSPEDLEKRGDYEMVSCLFQLRHMTPEEAEQEVKKLLGPQGSVVVLAKAKQLFVTETAGRLKTIRKMLDAIENPSANDMVRTFRINPATVDQVLSIVRQMFQIPADQTANADGTLRFAIDPGGSRLLVSGSPEMLDRFSQLLQALDPSATDGTSALESTPQLEVYPITSADPQMVLQVFQTLLAGMPDVRLAIDPKTGALVAWARPAQHATIRATLQQLQGEVGQVEVIPLRVVDPQLAVLAISKLFGTTGDSSSSNAPTVDADLSTRMLLVRGTKAQIDQIRQLLIKMGEPADASGGTNLSLMRTIPMDAATAQAVLNQMQSLWPQVRPNRLQVIRSVVPAESGSAPSASGEEEQIWSNEEPAERGVEVQRIPLPEAMTSTSRLMLGLKPQTSASPTSSSTTGTSPSPQQPSFPQPWAGQSPFSRPWRPPGGFMPGGGPGFFERRSDSGGRDHGRDGWRGSDRTTYSNRDSMLVVASSDVSNDVDLTSEPASTGRPRIPAFFISEEKTQEPEQQAGSESNNDNAPSQPASGNLGVSAEEAKPAEPAMGESPLPPNESQQATQPSATTEMAEAPASPPPVIVAVTPEGLVVASQDPEALNQFENLVRRMASQDVSQYAGPELVVYYLKNSKAESVASILDQILGGGTITSSGSSGGSLIGEIARAAFGNVGGGLVGSLLGIDSGSGSSTTSSSTTRTTSRIQITPDARLNALIVQAYPQDLQLIEEILRVLDQQSGPQDVAVQPKTIIIPVKNTQAEEIASILRSVYQDRLVTAASANRGPSPQEIIQLLRGGGRGGPGGGSRTQPQEEVQRMSIGVDVRTNSLIISAPERLLSEVRQLVEQLDQKAVTESEETTQVVTLQRASPDSVRTALSALLGSGVQIRGSTSSPRVTSSSGTTSSNRGSSSSSSRFPSGGFSSPFGQMPFGGFRPPGQFGSSSSSSGRTRGR